MGARGQGLAGFVTSSKPQCPHSSLSHRAILITQPPIIPSPQYCSSLMMSSGHAKANGSTASPHAQNGGIHPAAKKHCRSSPSPITADEIRSEYAHHDPSVARINHGSFGSSPASVLAAQQRIQSLYLSQPDAFYFDSLKPGLLRSRALIKSLINADSADDVALVDNATTAAAIVLQQAQRAFFEGRFERGDAVVMLHYAYGSVKKSMQAYVVRAGGRVVEVQLPFPVASGDEVAAEFRKALALGKAGGGRVRLAVIDHITSMPSVVLPVKDLTRICREEAVDQVFVDGAHAIGNIPVDVKDIGADFYTSNLHKWFFCPPSVAFLHCRRTAPASSALHHPVVTSEYGSGLAVESGWIGTRDYSAQMVVPEALEFVNRFEGGIDGIRLRNHEKVVEMGRMLADAWGTHLGSPPEMCSSMAMVGLPACLGIDSDDDALRLRRYLRESFRVETPIYFNAPPGNDSVGGEFVTGYVRISYQIYNVAGDFYRLRDAVNQLVADGFTCRKLLSC